jgi:hypothetical protein
MTRDPNTAEAPDGQMFLYRQPELLNHQDHGNLGLKRSNGAFDFAREARVLPLTLPELPRAQLSYPIIFSDLENPVPMAMVGAGDGVNLFVDERGQWETGDYVPAYVRCYPFTFANGPDGQYAAVIDRAAEVVSDMPDQPFFDGDKVTPETQTLIDFCGRCDAEREKTMEFGSFLLENKLLTKQQATQTSPDGRQLPIADFFAVDESVLNELKVTNLDAIMHNGFLACIFAHLFSLANWPRLVERQIRRTRAATP